MKEHRCLNFQPPLKPDFLKSAIEVQLRAILETAQSQNYRSVAFIQQRLFLYQYECCSNEFVYQTEPLGIFLTDGRIKSAKPKICYL